MNAPFPWLVVAMVRVAPVYAGQAPNAAAAAKMPTAKRWVMPRTPDGHPDLQGVWDFRTATPLERPREFAGQEFLSNQNVVAVERRAAERLRVHRPDDSLMNTPPWWPDYNGRRRVLTPRPR